MLVLNRRKGERIIIASRIQVTVLDVRGNCVRLGFIAPDEVPIHREEVFHRIRVESRADTPLPCGDRHHARSA